MEKISGAVKTTLRETDGLSKYSSGKNGDNSIMFAVTRHKLATSIGFIYTSFYT